MTTPWIRSFFIALGLSLSLLSGVACSPKETRVTPVVKVPPKTTKIVVKKLRAAEMKPEDKQIQDWSMELKKSHEIFREVWAHIWEDRLQSPMSVFFEIERLMRAHKSPVDGHFMARLQQCPARASEIQLLREGAKITGAVFYRVNCAQNERIELARVHHSGTRHTWTFYAEHMPRSAGQSLAFLKEKTTCETYVDQRERLTSLNCKNLGQNRDSELHLLFSEFKYQKNADTLVQVEGKKFKLLTTPVCDSEKFCTLVKVPLNGAIVVFEDTVSDQVRQERKQAQLEKERAEEARVALEAHKKFVKEMQAKAQNLQKQGQLALGVQPGALPTGPVVPGQMMDPLMHHATQEPQFGDGRPAHAAPAHAGTMHAAPQPGVEVVGPDGIATQPVMEFDHSLAGVPVTPTESEEDYRARLGQPEDDAPSLPRDASIPPER